MPEFADCNSYRFFIINDQYVRENTLLAVGDIETLPDYDYAENVKLCLYMLHDGGKAQCSVTDTAGNTVLNACASREGNRITLRVDALEKHPVFVLTNIHRVKEVTGAEMKESGYGLVLRPLQEEVTVELG